MASNKKPGNKKPGNKKPDWPLDINLATVMCSFSRQFLYLQGLMDKAASYEEYLTYISAAGQLLKDRGDALEQVSRAHFRMKMDSIVNQAKEK